MQRLLNLGAGDLSGKALGQVLRHLLLEQCPQGEVLIYLSGYGITVADSLGEMKGYLAVSDCMVETEGTELIWQQHGIALDSLNDLIRKGKSIERSPSICTCDSQ